MLIAPRLVLAKLLQEPIPKAGAAKTQARLGEQGPIAPYDINKALDAIRPTPIEPIPDNPPPHEGAFFELPYRIYPPDLLYVEVLEALPGRPITGEKLVRPDGTISLHWYGDVHVAGLTRLQAKQKIILHLRQFLTDDTLGLITFQSEALGELPSPGTIAKGMRGIFPDDIDLRPTTPRPQFDDEKGPHQADPFSMPALDRPRTKLDKPQIPSPTTRSGHTFADASKAPELVVPPDEKSTQSGNTGSFPVRTRDETRSPGPVGAFVYIAPVQSDRVSVDISAYNSTVYYVQGNVDRPGRISFTGHDTILDALNYAGGILPTADDSNIRLYRPGRGKHPSREYPIDHRSILRGDHRANLQMFPGDRLIVGRKDPNIIFGAR